MITRLPFLVCLWMLGQQVASTQVQITEAFPNLDFFKPVFLTHAGDGTNRIFVVQQDGYIKVFPNDSAVTSATTFLDIEDKLSSATGEEGLLGLAFHPDYETNGHFYVNYTAASPLRTVVSRFSVRQDDPNKADSLSEQVILTVDQPYTNHNGGMVLFGADGYLYVGMGDGGSGGDPGNRAQDLQSLLGKILRIDVDTTSSYRIPPTNPFFGNPNEGREELFAWGFRNPWRFSEDPATGLMFVGDVGQGTWEEIDDLEIGLNYGWRCYEGFTAFNPDSCGPMGDYTFPIKVYPHSGGDCSVTGGYIYRGYRRLELEGAYIYGDYCTGKVWLLRYENGQVLADSLLVNAPFTISSFGIDEDAELYMCNHNGNIQRFVGPRPSSNLAQFGIRYGSTGDAEPINPGALITIDPLTGAGTLIGPTGIMGDNGPAVRALAIKSTGEVYSLSHEASSDLYTVHASTGLGTFVANTGLLYPGDIVFNQSDVLYAVDQSNVLYTVDPVTGTRTVVGPTGVSLAGLAYDPTDGMMYGSSGSTDSIYTVNTTTGDATAVGSTGFGIGTPDILFDQDGNLFGAIRGAGNIYDMIFIDKTTGAGTVIGSTGFYAVVGLATRLEYTPEISCEAIDFFAAKCNANGAAQAMVRLLNSTEYAGQMVGFMLDGVPHPVELITNGTHTIGRLQVPAAGFGQHTMTLSDPSGCYDPIVFVCQVNSAKSDPEFDALWAEYDNLFADISVTQTLPQETRLIGNYPNPFNPSTTFRYSLASPGQVSLKVYNMLGQLVRTMVDEHQTEGYHEVVWDGRNEIGATVASGIYVYRIIAGSFVETKRMILMK